MNYYFVACSLPQLTLGAWPLMSYEEVRLMLMMNLDQGDLEQLRLFQLQVDFQNIRALWLSQPLDQRGNLSEKELEEDLLVRSFLPSFVGDYMDRYETLDLRLRYFPQLFVSLYADLLQTPRGFLANLLRVEKEIKLCLALLRIKRWGGDLASELQFEDIADPFVMQLLMQKEGKDILLPQEYEDLKAVFSDNSTRPKDLLFFTSLFRMKKIEELQQERPFGMEKILGYLKCLLIVEDFASLDYDRGRFALHQVCV